MDAGDWIALGGVVLALVFQSIGVAIFLTRVASQVQTNAKAIEHLERADAECRGQMAAHRTEFNERLERAANRLSAHETKTANDNSSLTAALTKIEATFSTGIAAMRESLDRLLEAERVRLATPTAPPPNILDQLQQFAAIQKMLKGAA